MRDHGPAMTSTERADPSTPSEATRRTLIATLDREPVAAAYLFGSQASATAGPLSDLDVGVLVMPSVAVGERFRLRLELIARAGRALRSGDVDLVVLNDAPVLLCHRVLRDGERLLERDRPTRVRFETRTILEYLDTKPLRAGLARGVRRRLEEGTFGRR